ncbi:hypothetical protein GCM10017566_58370 [Amycolatopsis bartoniae]|uniref:Uncharacterized protein n=1 Tax=Amycolatopsis bartoniae TaxID=941986 RepID=A0A8H9J4M6_9PSEU|nr:hypothetical protein GCM10017566_58370 [Amycolatopsis bartoniae]
MAVLVSASAELSGGRSWTDRNQAVGTGARARLMTVLVVSASMTSERADTVRRDPVGLGQLIVAGRVIPNGWAHAW